MNEISPTRKRMFPCKINKKQTVSNVPILERTKEEFISMTVLRDKFIKHCSRRGLKEKTLESYSEHCGRLIRYLENTLNTFNPNDVDTESIELYIDYLKNARKVTNVYINTNIRNTKPFFLWMLDNRYIDHNPYKGIKKLKEDKKRKQILSNEEVKAILDQIDLISFTGVRDWLIVQMLYGCGLRIGECLSLRIQDVDLSEKTVYIETSKNREDSYIPLPESMVKPLKKYLKQYFQGIEKDRYIFPNTYGEKLHTETFLKNLKEYGKKAGVPHVTCHLFRHSFAVSCLLSGASTSAVRRMLRHRDLNTIEQYIHWLPQSVQEQFTKYNPLDKMYNINTEETPRID